MRRNLLPALVVGLSVLAGATVLAVQQRNAPAPPSGAIPSEDQAAATTYENLATAIIAIEKTEDDLVKTILLGYHTAAQRRLRMAGREGADRKAQLEGAATDITNIANEGNAAIRAIRQRLAQAGHTHNTDVETKEDYMFINSREKKELLALAQKVAQTGGNASADDLRAVSTELSSLFAKAIAPE